MSVQCLEWLLGLLFTASENGVVLISFYHALAVILVFAPVFTVPQMVFVFLQFLLSVMFPILVISLMISASFL